MGHYYLSYFATVQHKLKIINLEEYLWKCKSIKKGKL